MPDDSTPTASQRVPSRSKWPKNHPNKSIGGREPFNSLPFGSFLPLRSSFSS